MKRVLAIILTLGLMGAMLTACDQEGDASSSSKEESETTTSTTKVEDVEEEEFTLEAGLTDMMKERAILRDGDVARLSAVLKRAQSGEDITIGFIGGSITAGSVATGNKGYASMLHEWFKEKFPDIEVTLVNAGIGATDSYLGVHRVDRDLLESTPDIVFVEFSVNDGAFINKDSYESLVLKILRAENNPAVVALCMAQSSGDTYQETHKEIGDHYDLPMISLWNCFKPTVDAGFVKWADILVDGIHPADTGHDLVRQMLSSYLEKVIADIDNAPTEITSLPDVLVDRFANAKILNAQSEELASAQLTGFEAGKIFMPFKDGYSSKEAGSSIKFTVQARSLGITYLKQINGAPGQAEIYINGKLVKTLDADFSGGWGNFAQSEEVFTSDASAEIEVEIKIAEGDQTDFSVLAILLS